LGKTFRARLRLEELESRLVPTSLAPTAQDQLMLQELNAIRANPAAYGQSIGLNLSGVAPSQPLAWDPRLIYAAQQHSQSMNQFDYFGHTDPSGADPGQRMLAAGYDWFSWGESIAAGYPDTASTLEALIIDAGVPSLDHRQQLLALTSLFQDQSQIGIGIVMNGTGPYQNYFTIDTAAPSYPLPFLTGVVYNDANGNGQYDVGEGLGGVTITVVGVGSTTTFASGGYEMQLAPGTYTVIAKGGGLAAPQIYQVTIGGENVEQDVISGKISSYQTSLTNWIQQTYQTYLQRAATATEVATSINELASGVTETTIVAGIKQSAEYRQDNTIWLSQLYQNALGTAIPQATLNSYLTTLAGAGTRASVAQTILTTSSALHYRQTQWITGYYQTYLSRAPLPSEVQQWLTDFQNGWTPTQVIGALATGSEFTARFGKTNAAFIQALFQDALGRQPTALEQSTWLASLQKGVTRAAMVQSILSGSEYKTDQANLSVVQIFAAYLDRPPTSAELTQYITLVLDGTNQATIELMLVTGTGYYQRAVQDY
jgi:uncharacterized protein YkwD